MKATRQQLDAEEQQRHWREVAALKRRAAWLVFDGGRLGSPRTFDPPYRRPQLELIRGGVRTVPAGLSRTKSGVCGAS